MLTACYQAGKTRTFQALWLCQCECGRPTAVQSGNLVSGATKSCGCQTRGNKGKPVKNLPMPNNVPLAIEGMKRRYKQLNELADKIDFDPDGFEEIPEELSDLYDDMDILDNWFGLFEHWYGKQCKRRAETNKKQCPATDEFQDIIRAYADEEDCFDFAVELRWPNGIECPYCECQRLSFISTRKVWHCKECKKRFSVKVGTIMEDSAIPLTKWIPAYCIFDETNGSISSCELARVLGVCQKTAWLMIQRIRQSYPSILRSN